MFLARLFHRTAEVAPAYSTTAARLQQGIELHSAFANGCIHCRGSIGGSETCVIYRSPLRLAHIACHDAAFRAKG